MNYQFVFFQNGKELYHGAGVNKIGGDYSYFIFENPGSITIRIENLANPNFFAEENTVVLVDMIKIIVPAILFIIVLFWMKKI